MKPKLKKSLAVSVSVLAMSAGAVGAQDAYDWSGAYGGVTLSGNMPTGETQLDYGSQGDQDAGWEADGFWGETRDDIDSVTTRVNTDPAADTTFAMDVVNSWLTALENDSVGVGAGLVLGFQRQTQENLVLGFELQASFSDLGQSYEESWSESGTIAGSLDITAADSEGTEAYRFDFGDGPPILTGRVPAFDEHTMTWNGTFEQVSALAFDLDVGATIAPMVRVGAAQGRFHLFAAAGPAYSRATLRTSATVMETATGTVSATSGGSGQTDSTCTSNCINLGEDVNWGSSNTYNWSGSTTEDLLGYRVGVGVEYAATDAMTVRLAYEYTDLGSISTVGSSSDVDVADYTVSSDIRNSNVSMGLLFQF